MYEEAFDERIDLLLCDQAILKAATVGTGRTVIGLSDSAGFFSEPLVSKACDAEHASDIE